MAMLQSCTKPSIFNWLGRLFYRTNVVQGFGGVIKCAKLVWYIIRARDSSNSPKIYETQKKLVQVDSRSAYDNLAQLM